MSQTEDIAELKRCNEELRGEKEAAVKRAAVRYRDMMHANRRAERAEQAFNIEASERQDDQMRAASLFYSYKETINALEMGIAQAQRSGPHDEQIQALQTANAGLEATLVQFKTTMAQLQADTQQTVRELHVRFAAEKVEIKMEADRRYEKRLAEAKKQLGEHFSYQAQASVTQIQKAHQSSQKENQSLKLQLHEALNTVEWHKRQTQQLAGQRASNHAGFPLPPPRHPAQVTEPSNKRRRLDSIGYVSEVKGGISQTDVHSNAAIPTPDRLRRHGNSTGSTASAATLKRKAEASCKEQMQTSKQPTTPILSRSPSHSQTSPYLQAGFLRRPQPQNQSPQPHLQRNPQVQHLFSNFLQQMNLQRSSIGQAQLSAQEAVPQFNHWFAGKIQQESATLESDGFSLQPMLQNSGYSSDRSGHGGAMSAGLQTSTSVNMLSPSVRQTKNASHMQSPHRLSRQQYQQKQQPQQQRGDFQISFPSLTMSNQGQSDAMPSLDDDHDNQPLIMPTNEAIHDQGPSIQGTAAAHMDLAAQLSLELMSPSSKDSTRVQDVAGFGDQAQDYNWGLLLPQLNHSSPNIEEGQIPSNQSNGHLSGVGFNFNDSMMTSASTQPPIPAQMIQQSLLGWHNQHSQNNNAQHEPQHESIDPALLFIGEAQPATSSMPNQQNSLVDQYTSLQRLQNEAPGPSDLNPTQIVPNHPPKPRKRPTPPPSTRSTPAPSLGSTPAPAGPPLPVCLNCHENWWNDSCNVGEPCQNCIGSHQACERPKCLNFAIGSCSNARCPRVHEGDTRYRNVVFKPKTLKRIGKKGDQKPSPSVLALQQG